MGPKADVKLRIVRSFEWFSIFFLFLGSPAFGEGYYTRMDELACGKTRVEAVTTCTADSSDRATECTEQQFLFFNQTTQAFVRVKASHHPIVHRDIDGKRVGVWLDGVAGDWACLKGKAGSYIVIRYGAAQNYEGWARFELFDGAGVMVASDKDSDDKLTAFDKTWHSLGLPEPWPWDSFVSIQLFKSDKR